MQQGILVHGVVTVLNFIIIVQARELTYKKEQLQQLVDLVSKFRGLENKILKLKYIDGMTLEGIGIKLKYSPSLY